jgi:hypothetical protein
VGRPSAPSAGSAQGPTHDACEAPTQHTCNAGAGPYFGRKTPGCPRCDELLEGAEPRQLPQWRQALIEQGARSKAADQERELARREHFKPGGEHSRKTCGPICTFGDW